MYDDVFNNLLDQLIPSRSITRRPRRSDPWFDAECHAAKRLTRRLEWAYAATCRRLSGVSTVTTEPLHDPTSVATRVTAARTAWYEQRQVAKVRSSTSNEPPPTFVPRQADASFHEFSRISVDDVTAAVSQLPDKSSATDPIPTFVLKRVIDLIAPFVAELYNLSLTHRPLKLRGLCSYYWSFSFHVQRGVHYCDSQETRT